MSSVLCNTTDGYGVFGFPPMILGILGVILVIAIVATLMVTTVSGSQWAIAFFMIAVVALVLLVLTWWTSIEAAEWIENGTGIVILSFLICAGAARLGIFVIEETA